MTSAEGFTTATLNEDQGHSNRYRNVELSGADHSAMSETNWSGWSERKRTFITLSIYTFVCKVMYLFIFPVHLSIYPSTI